MIRILTGKRVVVTGGTGSLGKSLVRRLLGGELGQPAKVIVFSRDEVKQHTMRLEYKRLTAPTDEVIYRASAEQLEFVIGDVRHYATVCSLLRRAHVVIHAAALKQVPTCEYFPYEAVQTNVLGAENIVRAIREHSLPVDTVIGVSSDKAVEPVNVYGLTKGIQERIFTTANLTCSQTRFGSVRYGNVLASRGSVIPLFAEQIRQGGPVTITSDHMTRFLMDLRQAVDTVFTAIYEGNPGEVYIPLAPSARMVDVARAMIGDRPTTLRVIGVRPGEKLHEILVSEEECCRTVDRPPYYVIQPILPELQALDKHPGLSGEYSSADNPLEYEAVRDLLRSRHLLPENGP